MSIKAELTNLLEVYKKTHKEIRLQEKELISIFGENFEKNIFSYCPNFYYLLFEEGETLYFAEMRDNKTDACFNLITFSKTGHFYRKVEENDLKMILKEKASYEQKLSIFNKILDHKKFKIKKIFIS